MTWLHGVESNGARGGSEADVLGLRPALAEGYRAFEEPLRSGRLVDPVVLELCRLRIAGLLGDAAGAAARRAEVPAEKVAALPEWPTSALFSELERACLGLAERFVIDVHGITDADVEAVRRLLSPAEVVALTCALGLFEGMTRFRLVLGVGA